MQVGRAVAPYKSQTINSANNDNNLSYSFLHETVWIRYSINPGNTSAPTMNTSTFTQLSTFHSIQTTLTPANYCLQTFKYVKTSHRHKHLAWNTELFVSKLHLSHRLVLSHCTPRKQHASSYSVATYVKCFTCCMYI